MASGGEKWETVGKSKANGSSKQAQTNGKPGKKPNNNSSKPLPKMEDVLPSNSLKNMYSDAFFPGENPAAAKAKQAAAGDSPKKDNKNGDNNAKKGGKKDLTKPSMPTSLEAAIKANLKVDDLKQLMDASQKKFPDNPLLWLRDIAAYLNKNLEYELPNGKQEEPECLSSTPLSALSANMRKAINHILHPCADSMKENFIETCISNMAHEMAKGAQVAGWKILCQALVEVNPGLVLSSIPRYIELRNSYQNRPAIGLTFLWAVGQAGKRDFSTGLKVWLELMVPLLPLRNYTRFVVDYMVALLSAHADFKPNKQLIDISNFITLQETVFVVGSQINKDSGRELREVVYPKLKNLVLKSNTNHEMFPTMLGRIRPEMAPEQVLDTMHILAETLASTPASLVHWHKMYISYLSQSGQLLLYLNNNWDKYKSALQTEDFESTLEAFQAYNATATAKEGVAECANACDSLAKKLAQSKRKSWFPWKTMIIVLALSTAFIIDLDVKKNGSFRKSHFGQFLHDIGQYERAVNMAIRIEETFDQGYKWGEVNLPIYYQKAREVAGPTLDTAVAKAQELGSQGYNYMSTGLNEVKHGVDRYMPGLQKQAALYGETALRMLEDTGKSIGKLTKDMINGNVDWDLALERVKSGAADAQEGLVSLVAWARVRVENILK